MLELTHNDDGSIVLINKDAIKYIRMLNTGCSIIMFMDGTGLTVREHCDTIMEMMSAGKLA